jgi:hypothetical protein
MRILPLMMMSCGSVPQHEPHKLCGTIMEKFTTESGGYKRGSTTILHFSFLPHGQKERIDMSVSSNYYINHGVGDTICGDFCHYGNCGAHFYDWR